MKRKEFLGEIEGLSVEELQARASEIGEELMKLRFRKAVGQLEQSHLPGQLKRNLARVNTLISRKQTEAAA